MKNLHPFPARMAPEIALASLKKMPDKSTILDPMTGSGTVIRQAVMKGHNAIAYDMDPLAVLMSKVGTQKINWERLDTLYSWLLKQAKNKKKAPLPWIDNDPETKAFVKYWFAQKQGKALRQLSYVLYTSAKLNKFPAEINILRLTLSKLIITKKSGASLAWDVSHSRPHKVSEVNDFDVWDGYARAYAQLKKALKEQNISGKSSVRLGDARKMTAVKKQSVDAVITSPPYLNAIDYLRGHKMSLVWLGYSVAEIRGIRGNSIGVEKRRENKKLTETIDAISKSLSIHKMPARQTRMIERYTYDACLLMKEIARVLKPNGKAIFVVGNSCLKDVYVENSKIFCEAAKLYKLNLKKQTERELPIGSRYLPLPKDTSNALSKRMKTEVILEFAFG